MPQLEDNQDPGLSIENLFDSGEFLSRRTRPRSPELEASVLARLQHSIEEDPGTALDALVHIGLESCHADSCGISLEEESDRNELQFRWVAVAGAFACHLNGIAPRFYSPCGTCLDRGVPLHIRVTNSYFNFLGLRADPILDGILMPWRAAEVQGTIWLVSHTSLEAFDRQDYELLHKLSDRVAAHIKSCARGRFYR